MRSTLQSLSLLLAALTSLAGLALTGCTIRTGAERRIDRNPQLYAQLGGDEKEQVRRGRIEEGMSRDAVYLAWGRPDRVRTGSRRGQGKETWAYFDSVPVTTASIGFSTYGHHPFHSHFGVHPRYGYCVGPGWGYGSGVDFVPYIDRTVEFAGDRVVAWERTR